MLGNLHRQSVTVGWSQRMDKERITESQMPATMGNYLTAEEVADPF